jgi:hypothetical protein
MASGHPVRVLVSPSALGPRFEHVTWRWQTGTRPGVAVRGRRRSRPPATLRGDDQAPALCARAMRLAASASRRGTRAPSAPRPSQPIGTLLRFRPLEGALRMVRATVSEHASSARGHLSHDHVIAARVSPRWKRQGGAVVPDPAAPKASAAGSVGRGASGVSAMAREYGVGAQERGAYGSRGQCGAGHRGSSDLRRPASAGWWRHRLVLCGARSRAAASARSRGSPFGFARAVVFESTGSAPTICAAARWQHRVEGVAAPNLGLSRDPSFEGERGYTRVFASTTSGSELAPVLVGPDPVRQRGSEQAMKRGSEELVASAATPGRSVWRMWMRRA